MNDWYSNAIFYQALVSAFHAPEGTQHGTLRGVTEKLDYLKWLGIDCVWLPPFYDSPLRDDGYDISDYRAIQPYYGTMADLEELIDAAHDRGIKIITDLALNHTSDQHHWFQESRRDPDGPYGDYYVWADHPNRYPEIRVIFTDVETSNWQYDEVRGQYFFHRFYAHQPDLNYDCPAVHDEVFGIIKFWMDKGLDGFRLDAIPYLYERDGLGGESLPETIEFIEKIRAFLDEHYPEAIMLAEANQPPRETMEFFGDRARGEAARFHMVFNFPLMPRLFKGLALGDAAPIYDILREMPPLPPTAQWGTFVRNHDELTLEMVPEAERDLFYETYAPDVSHRAHVGIARRLAPLMDGDRRKVELMFSLLMSLPGAPFIYYGDEIGMGDDTSLPDRDAVRTPMQWDATVRDLRRPMVRGEYGPENINVAAQVEDERSLLHAVRRLIHARRELPVMGTNAYQPIEVNNPGVLAFARGEVTCLHNLTGAPVTAEGVELPAYGFVWLIDGSRVAENSRLSSRSHPA